MHTKGSGYPSAVASANADNSLSPLQVQEGERASIVALQSTVALADDAAAAAARAATPAATPAASPAAPPAATTSRLDLPIVYLGNLRHCCSEDVMRNLKIKYIVDAAYEGDDMFETRDHFKRDFGIE